MILGTHRKTSNWRSRTAAAVMIIGAATLSAPLIQADAHPEKQVAEEELAGKYDSHQGKSVIKRKVKLDGKTISEHFEINVDGDDVKAYKIGPNGKKTRVDIDTIEGVDVADIVSENIEGDVKHSITISDGDGVKFMSLDDFKKWTKTEYPEWKEKEFTNHKGTMVMRKDDGKTHFEFKNFPHPPNTPIPPRFTRHSENVFVIEGEDLKGLENFVELEVLKGLEGLEKLEALSELKGLEGLEGLEDLRDLEKLGALKNLDYLKTYSFFDDDENNVKLKLHVTESKLAAARSILEGTEVEANDSREMAKAKRELEKARKALKAAERALRDAE